MRAALPLKATNARAERAEERARANALRAQIDELNAALVVANAKAERALAEERQRADRLNEQVKALTAEVVRAEKQAEAAVGRAERAEAGGDAERARADALRTTIDELKAGQALMTEMHAREAIPAEGWSVAESARRWAMTGDDSLTAAVRGDWHYRLERPGLEADVRAETRFEATRDAFLVDLHLHVEADGAPFAERHWKERIPRRGV